VGDGPNSQQRYCKAALALTVSALTHRHRGSAWRIERPHAFGGYGERIISSKSFSDWPWATPHEGGDRTAVTPARLRPTVDCAVPGAGSGSGVGAVSGGITSARELRPNRPVLPNFYTQGGLIRPTPKCTRSARAGAAPCRDKTFLTLPPFHPHEMLYKHTTNFTIYYERGRGMNRTRSSIYSYPPVKTAVSNFYGTCCDSCYRERKNVPID